MLVELCALARSLGLLGGVDGALGIRQGPGPSVAVRGLFLGRQHLGRRTVDMVTQIRSRGQQRPNPGKGELRLRVTAGNSPWSMDSARGGEKVK